MKRILAVLMLSALAVTAARAETRVQVNIGLAPPPPAVVFRAPPPMVYVPDQRVYVVDDDDLPYDCFRYGAYFYIYNDGWWYRSRYYNRGFRAVEASYVPRPIWNVPQTRWKQHPHGMPPGQAMKYGRGDNRGWGDDRGRGHGHGRGHGDRD